MLLPYPLVQGTLPNDWVSLNSQWNGHFYYFGTVLLVAFLASTVSSSQRLLVGGSSLDVAEFSSICRFLKHAV